MMVVEVESQTNLNSHHNNSSPLLEGRRRSPDPWHSSSSLGATRKEDNPVTLAQSSFEKGDAG